MEAAMDTSSRRHDLNQDDLSQDPERPVTSWLHPRVYALLIGFAGWFALAVWSFAGSGVTDYLLVIVSGFIFVVVALQLILSRVGHTNDTTEAGDSGLSLRSWATRDFDTWQDRLSGAQAALQILLPIAVAALGMTAFGVAFHIVEHGGT
jgi:uncharacterized RDD family membrane protein YckC